MPQFNHNRAVISNKPRKPWGTADVILYTFVGLVPLGLGLLAGMVTLSSANDTKAEWWATALAGVVSAAFLALSAIALYFPLRGVMFAPEGAASVETPPGPARPGDRPRRLGGKLIGICLTCLVMGRLIVFVFAPEMVGNGIQPATLLVLVPIWTLGIVGLILYATGWIRGQLSPV